MKQGSNQRRSRGRNPNGGGRRNSRSHTFESNGPEVKVRGTAQQVLDKYLQLARDVQAGGDRGNAEAYLQFAEHYYRILNVEREAEQSEKRAARGDGNEHKRVESEQQDARSNHRNASPQTAARSQEEIPRVQDATPRDPDLKIQSEPAHDKQNQKAKQDQSAQSRSRRRKPSVAAKPKNEATAAAEAAEAAEANAATPPSDTSGAPGTPVVSAKKSNAKGERNRSSRSSTSKNVVADDAEEAPANV